MSPPVPPTPPVAPLPPPSEERKKECCEIEEKNRGKGISGGFVCCDGHAIPCAWNIEHFGMNEEQLSVPANVAFIAAVDKCTILHEEQHIEDSFPCKPGKGVERGKLLAGEVHERSECIAYQIQVDCLRKEQSNVDSHFHETLQAMVNEHVKFANTEYNCVNHGLEVK